MSEFNPPKTSRLIQALQKLVDEFGDLPVSLKDQDSGYYLPIGVEHHFSISEGVNLIRITSDYHDKPDNCIED